MTFIATKLFHKAGEGSGGGGGDQHNLGWYATESALTTAHPTASDGDYAIVGDTDTVWVWDGDTNAWKDTDTKGQVTSVNGQTGAVTVDTLPDQTGNAGKFLTTDGTDASWSDKPLVNEATLSTSVGIKAATSYAKAVYIGDGITVASSGGNSVLIGYNTKITVANTAGNTIIGAESKITGQGGSTLCGFYNSTSGRVATIVGTSSTATGNYPCVFGGSGNSATANYAIQLGGYNKTNSDANTFKVGNENGNFEMMSADGTIPTARLTKVNTTITLAAADWSSNTQTVSVTGMTATGIVMVSPDPTDQSAYTSAGIICSAQAAGTLTFTCSITPTADLSVNVVML